MLQPGSNLGPYRILEQLGRGGMATVYKAYEPALDRNVALKVLPAEYLAEPEFGERFRREAAFIAKLEHQNIVPVYAFGVDGGHPWMAMRLIVGGSLAQAVAGGALSAARTVEVIQAVANALDYAHQRGVVHRDIKPQNILLDREGTPYLADFGIARMVEDHPSLAASGQETQPIQGRITRTGIILGTPEYMAPEQARGGIIDHRVDVYALGIVAYEALTGRVPFSADTPVAVLMKHLSDPIPLLDPAVVPDPAQRVILKALAKNPPDRWESAGRFATALRETLPASVTVASQTTSLGLAEGPDRPGSTNRPPWVRHLQGFLTERIRPRAATVVCAIALLAAGGVYVARRQPAPRSGSAAPSPGEVRPIWTADTSGLYSLDKRVVDLSTVLIGLAKAANTNLIVEPGIDDTVDMTFEGVELQQALRTLLIPRGLGHTYDGRLIRVFRRDAVEALIERVRKDPARLGDLRLYGQFAEQALPLVRSYMSGPDPGVRLDAAWVMVTLDPKARDAVAVLESGARSSDQKIRVRALKHIRELGPIAADAGSAVRQVLKASEKGDERRLAASFLVETQTGRPKSKYSGEAVDFELRHSDLREFLTSVALISGLSFVPDPEVKGDLTCRFKDMRWDEVIDIVFQAHQLGYLLDESVVRVGYLRNLEKEESAAFARKHTFSQHRQVTLEYRCKGGDAAGCLELGQLHDSEMRVPEALTAYRKACDAHIGQGCFSAALKLEDAAPKQLDAVVTLYEMGCAAGDGGSCNNLGAAYQDGVGRPKDLTHAAELFRKGCDAGGGWGCANLGLSYLDGRGVAKDAGKAVALLEKACGMDGSFSFHCGRLAGLYLGGEGIAKDAGKAVALLERRCASRDESACGSLADLLLRGEGVKKDPTRAVRLLESGCAAGELGSCISLGVWLYEGEGGVTKDPERAASLFQIACDGGIPSPLCYQKACDGGEYLACRRLGDAYASGDRVAKDPTKAAQRYREACDGGDSPACYTLGFAYADGDGVAKDFAKAAQLYQKACDRGSASGCAGSGFAYALGQGVAKDLAKAAQLFQKGCDGEHGWACFRLGSAYALGEGVTKDPAKAAQLLRKAAQLYQKACDGGSASGCARLGFAYALGEGVAKDLAKAAQLYQKACDGGDADGCYKLGRAYSTGRGVAKDLAKAALLYQKACDAEDLSGCSYLRYVYVNGEGVAKDPAKAAQLAQRMAQLNQKGCDAGDLEKCNELGLGYANGGGVPKDLAMAAQLFQKGCDGEYVWACFRLGSAYANGDGVAKDPAKAAQLLRKACDGGIAEACRK